MKLVSMLFLGLSLYGADWLVVANKGDNAVGIIDPAAGKQVAEVPEGGVTVHELIASHDGRLVYAPIYGNSGVGKPGTDGDTIIAIDLAGRKVVNTLKFDHGVRPHCPLIGPKDGMLYVTTEIDKTVSIIDPKTFKVVATIPTTQPESHMLVLSHDGRRGYTANVGPGTVSVLDIAGRKTLTVIPISKETQRIAISNDDKWVFTSDQTKPQLAVIDTASDKVARWVSLPGRGYGGAVTPDGRYLVIACPEANKVAAVDLRTWEVAHTVDTARAPQEVIVRPDGKFAYVSSSAEGNIGEISLTDWKLTKTIKAGKTADGLAWVPTGR